MVDVNSEMFDTLLNELNKVEELSSTVRGVVSSQHKISGEVTEVKEFVGFDEDVQTKNVIDKNKLPAKLSTQERVRYENIGKQFTLGAGKEFQKIREKIKFSEKMSTAKDTFIKGFEKIKSKVKSVKKGGGLWSKIFKIISLLGIIGLFFKDKLTSIFPKTTDFLKDMVEKIKTSLGGENGILSKMYKYLKDCISVSFKTALEFMSKDTIPIVVKKFFNDTLPNVMLHAWLQVMSVFSSSAQDQLSRLTGPLGDVDEVSSEVVADAEEQRQARQQAATENQYERQLRELRAIGNELNRGADNDLSEEQLNNFQRQLGIYVLQQQNADVITQMDKLVDIIYGQDVNLRQLIESGDFDVTGFLKQFEGISQMRDGQHAALMMAFNDNLRQGRLTHEQLSQRIAQSGETFRQAYTGDMQSTFTQMARAQQGLMNEVNASREVLRNRPESLSNSERFAQKALEAPTVVNLERVLDSVLSTGLTTVFTSINNFLTGTTGIDTFKNYLLVGVNAIKGFYNNFFNKSIDCLFRTVEGVSAIFNTIPNPQESTSETPISGNNNIIINVDMSDGTHNAINSAVQSLATVEGQIVNVITETNAKLETLKNTVAQINNLHAASKDYIDNVVQQSSTQLSLNALSLLSERLDSQNRQLSAITDTLFGDRNSAGNCIDSPLTLMALA